MDAAATKIDIVPVKNTDIEIWPDNGFATLPGEIVYYDTVEKNDNGKVVSLKRCVRAIEGTAKQYLIGTPIYGMVVAQHHNQLVRSIIEIEKTIGQLADTLNRTPLPPKEFGVTAQVDLGFNASLTAAMDSLLKIQSIQDDTCPDVQFEFNVGVPIAGGTQAEYCLRIYPYDPATTTFEIDFDDGTIETSILQGTHTFAFGGPYSPTAQITTSNCAMVIQPSSPDVGCDLTPSITNMVEPFYIPIPDVPDFPSFIFPRKSCPGPLMNLPPIMIPQMSLCSQALMSNLSLTISIDSILLPSIISIVGCCPPSQISIVGCCPPSFISIIGCCDMVSHISITGFSLPSQISLVGSITLPSQISIVGCCPPNQISLVGCCPPSIISIIGTVPNSISFTNVDKIPNNISLTGNIPTNISVNCCIPSIITVQCCNIPSLISIGPAPSFNCISFCTPPHFDCISFCTPPAFPLVSYSNPPAFPLVNFNVPAYFPYVYFATPPSFTCVSFCTPPSFTCISFCTPPTFAPITFATPPAISVNWGTPPTVSCVVAVTCPGTIAMAPDLPPGFGAADYQEEYTVNGNVEGIKPSDLGIPEEIKIVAPKIPDIKVLHDIPKEIALRMPTIPDIRIIGPEQPLPEKIHIVATDVPKSIILDATDVPRKIIVEPADNFPSVIKIEAFGIPDTLQVTGIPKSIEIVGNIPSTIQLVMPENPTIELVYKGGPLEMGLNSNIEKLLSQIMLVKPGG